MSKFDMNTHSVNENWGTGNKSSLVESIFSSSISSGNEIESRTHFQEIPVDKITPRSINKYKQNRIERLAKSIKTTNNRLIHPIIVVKASDLPEDHEVLKKYKEKGVDIDTLDYILVAGERRFRAWQLLRQEEAEKLKGTIGLENKFDTITANVLTKKEAKKEEVFYEDSNIEARQLSPTEAMLHVKNALAEVQTNEQKREALIEMQGSDEGISIDPDVAAKKFRADNYCKYYLEAELGIEGWSESNIRKYNTLVNNGIEDLIDAIIDGTISIRDAMLIVKETDELQAEYLKIYKEEGREIFLTTVNENKNEKSEKKKKVTKSTIKATFKKESKQLKNCIKELEEMSKSVKGEDLSFIKKTIADFEKINNNLVQRIQDL